MHDTKRNSRRLIWLQFLNIPEKLMRIIGQYQTCCSSPESCTCVWDFSSSWQQTNSSNFCRCSSDRGERGQLRSVLFCHTISILHTCTIVYEISSLFVTASALGHKEAGRKSEIRAWGKISVVIFNTGLWGKWHRFAFLGCFTCNCSRNSDCEEQGTYKKDLHKLMEKIKQITKIN